MVRHSVTVLAALAISASFSMATAADSKVDTAKAGAATGPIIRASTNTVINYAGGTPANIVGSLDAADSTFNRPLVGCAGLSGAGTAVAFDTVTFNNTSAGTATVNVRMGAAGTPAAACPSATGPDTFLVVYNGTFNPATPLAGCLVANDDAVSGTDFCSTLTAVSIPAGQTRVLVLSAFSNASGATGIFPYEVTFAGTTPVALQKFNVE